MGDFPFGSLVHSLPCSPFQTATQSPYNKVLWYIVCLFVLGLEFDVGCEAYSPLRSLTILTVFAEFPGVMSSLCYYGSILGVRTSLRYAIFIKQNLTYLLVWAYGPGGQLEFHEFLELLTNILSDI